MERGLGMLNFQFSECKQLNIDVDEEPTLHYQFVWQAPSKTTMDSRFAMDSKLQYDKH